MNERKLLDLQRSKDTLESLGVFYRELPNGQLQVDGINYWTTKEKWYDPKTSEKGVGFNSFLNYLSKQNILQGGTQ